MNLEHLFRRSYPYFVATLVFLLSGCASIPRVNSRYDTTFGKKHRTTNIYQAAPLPEYLKRVALLPLFKGGYDNVDMEPIEENMRVELVKRNLFEVISVQPESMMQMFNGERFSTAERLPSQLLEKLHDRYGIDGVLMLDISYFNAYQPVGIGFRGKLLDGRTGEIVWAADEVYDSSNPEVSNAARKFYKTEAILPYPLQNTQSVLHSPNRFSKYVANSLFSAIYLQNN